MRRARRFIAVVGLVAVLVLLPSLAVFRPVPTTRAESIQIPVIASRDDARSFGANGFSDSESVTFLGAGDGINANVVGFRFASVLIPRGAIIDRVQLSLVKASTQWQRLVVNLAFEATDNAADFTPIRSPRDRNRTRASTDIDSNVVWRNESRYAIGGMTQLAASLQEVVDRPGWTRGNKCGIGRNWSCYSCVVTIDVLYERRRPQRRPQLEIAYHIPSTSATATSPPVADVRITVTATIADPADDARSSDMQRFVAHEPVTLVGSGNGDLPNVTGFRFTGLDIPRDAVVEDVRFTMVKAARQWQRLVVDLAFEATDNADAFTATAPPAERQLTSAVNRVDQDSLLLDGMRYSFGESTALTEALQEVVSASRLESWERGGSHCPRTGGACLLSAAVLYGGCRRGLRSAADSDVPFGSIRTTSDANIRDIDGDADTTAYVDSRTHRDSDDGCHADGNGDDGCHVDSISHAGTNHSADGIANPRHRADSDINGDA